MTRLTHVDPKGDAHVVDVGEKPLTRREAVAEGFVTLGAEAMAAVVERRAHKGDVLAVAQLAGIQAAKRTSELVPLCHPLPLDAIDVALEVEPDTRRIRCEAHVRTTWRTGVEMEALTAVMGALLTVYDMLKAVDRTLEIGPVRLLAKSGGRTGDWTRT